MDLRCPCNSTTTILGSSSLKGREGDDGSFDDGSFDDGDRYSGNSRISSNEEEEEEPRGAWSRTACNDNVNRSSSFKCEINASTDECYLDPNSNNDCTTLCTGYPLWKGNSETHKCELPTNCSERIPNPYLHYPCGSPDCFYSSTDGVQSCGTVKCPPYTLQDESTGRCIFHEQCKNRVPAKTARSQFDCGLDCVYDPMVEKCLTDCANPDDYEPDEATSVCIKINCYRRMPRSSEDGRTRRGGVCGDECEQYGIACVNKTHLEASNNNEQPENINPEKKNGVPWWVFFIVIFAVVAVACVAVVVTVLLVRRSRKKRKAHKIVDSHKYIADESKSEASSAVMMDNMSPSSVGSVSSPRTPDWDDKSVVDKRSRKSKKSSSKSKKSGSKSKKSGSKSKKSGSKSKKSNSKSKQSGSGSNSSKEAEGKEGHVHTHNTHHANTGSRSGIQTPIPGSDVGSVISERDNKSRSRSRKSMDNKSTGRSTSRSRSSSPKNGGAPEKLKKHESGSEKKSNKNKSSGEKKNHKSGGEKKHGSGLKKVSN